MVHACLVTQSRPALCDSMDCSSPAGFQGILQARILEWVAIPFSRESFRPRNQTGVSCITGWILYCLRHQGSPINGNISKKKKNPRGVFLGLFNLLPQQRYVIKVALICC